MQDLLCKLCNQSYQTIDRLPKIIPVSNQTVCLTCITQSFDFTTSTGVCPFTQQTFQ